MFSVWTCFNFLVPVLNYTSALGGSAIHKMRRTRTSSPRQTSARAAIRQDIFITAIFPLARKFIIKKNSDFCSRRVWAIPALPFFLPAAAAVVDFNFDSDSGRPVKRLEIRINRSRHDSITDYANESEYFCFHFLTDKSRTAWMCAADADIICCGSFLCGNCVKLGAKKRSVVLRAGEACTRGE